MAINTQKLLPSSGGGLVKKSININIAKIANIGNIGGDNTGIGEELNVIKEKLENVGNLLKGTLADEKKRLTDEKNKDKKEKREKGEEKVEKDDDKDKDGKKGKLNLPKVPGFGIGNFLLNVGLGWIVLKIIELGPIMMPFLSGLAKVGDGLIDVSGKLLSGFATVISGVMGAKESSREWIDGTLGEDAAKTFDEFSGHLETFLNAVFIAAMLSSGGRGGKGLGKKAAREAAEKVGRGAIRRKGPKVVARYARRYGRDAAIRQFGEKSVRGMGGKFAYGPAETLARKVSRNLLGDARVDKIKSVVESAQALPGKGLNLARSLPGKYVDTIQKTVEWAGGRWKNIKSGAGAIASGATQWIKKKGSDFLRPIAKAAEFVFEKTGLKKISSLIGDKVVKILDKPPLNKIMAKVAKKGGGKLGAKAIPIIGGLVNFYFGIERIAKGDYTGGALEILSGILDISSIVSGGAGSVLSTIIDTYLFGRDMLTDDEGGKNFEAKAIGGLIKPLVDGAKDVVKQLPKLPFGGVPGGSDKTPGTGRSKAKRSSGATKPPKPPKPAQGLAEGGVVRVIEDPIEPVSPTNIKSAKIRKKVRRGKNPITTLFHPGMDISGGKESEEESKSLKDKMIESPLTETNLKIGKGLSEVDYFGPILAVTAKILTGEKPSGQDYVNVGRGINLLVNEGINEGKLSGGLASAMAEGGVVDSKLLNIFLGEGDISKWVEKSFKESALRSVEESLALLGRGIKLIPDPEPASSGGSSGSSGGSFGGLSGGSTKSGLIGALLDTIAFAEGTHKYPNNGYNTHFAGDQTEDLSKHPNIVKIGKNHQSAAFGRYQFMPNTWKGIGGGSMEPAKQDAAAIKLILKRLGINSESELETLLAQDGLTQGISTKLSPEWASFPNDAGQSTYPEQTHAVKKFSELRSKFEQFKSGPLSGGMNLGDAAASLKGMSSATGPDGGANGCAWAVNKVYKKAGLTPPWGNSLWVPNAEQAMLKKNYKEITDYAERQAGDIMIMYDNHATTPQTHIGVVLPNGDVLSNSSSRASFSWQASPQSYNDYYGNKGKIYRSPEVINNTVDTAKASSIRGSQIPTSGESYKPMQKGSKPKTIYLHWTAGGYGQLNVGKYHRVFDKGGKGHQQIPYNQRGNHTSARNTNSVGLSVAAMKGKGPYTEWPTSKQLEGITGEAARLAKSYGWGPGDINIKNIMTHGEAGSGRDGWLPQTSERYPRGHAQAGQLKPKNYGPTDWDGTGERWDLDKLSPGESIGSGGPKLRSMIKNKLRAYSSGGFTKSGEHQIIVGEEGREFVLDADSTRSLEAHRPGFLSALNKADYDGVLEVLQRYDSSSGNDPNMGGNDRVIFVDRPVIVPKVVTRNSPNPTSRFNSGPYLGLELDACR